MKEVIYNTGHLLGQVFFNQRDYVLPEDIKEIAQDVLNHRIILNYEAEADGITTRQIIENILRKVNINNYK